MKREDLGREWKFHLTLKSRLRLLPIAFGSRQTVGNEVHFHSYPGECLAVSWACTKNHHFLWSRPFTLITDCAAVQWLMTYKGHNHAVVRLQLEMLNLWFTIAVKPGQMLVGADYCSQMGEELHIDPLSTDYLKFARQNYLDFPLEEEELNVDNLLGYRKSRENQIENQFLTVKPSYKKLVPGPVLNFPVIFLVDKSTARAKPNHFLYASEVAYSIQSIQWSLYQPWFEHFLQSAIETSTPFKETIAIKPMLNVGISYIPLEYSTCIQNCQGGAHHLQRDSKNRHHGILYLHFWTISFLNRTSTHFLHYSPK